MDTVFAELVKQVISHYPFTAEDIYLLSYKGKKGVWSIQTEIGEVILKKVPFDENRIQFITHSINYLIENGVHTPRVLKTSSGDAYVKLDGEYFVAFEAVYGRSPQYEREEDLKMVLQGMAVFHRASAGIESPTGTFPSYLLTEWKADLQYRYERLAAWKAERSQADDKNEFDELFLLHADAFLQQGQASFEALEQSCLDQWVEETHKTKTLCHQDYAAGNLAIGEDGHLYVFDMDDLTVDLPTRDMRRILNKVMKKLDTGWDLKLMLRMMKYYQEVNPLTKDQYRVMAAELSFPHLYYGQVSKYYEKKEVKWTFEKHVARLNAMIATEYSKASVVQSFLEHLDEVVRDGGA